MEDTQWGDWCFKSTGENSLNPCCNGRYSMSWCSPRNIWATEWVLILVVMEDTQWDST